MRAKSLFFATVLALVACGAASSQARPDVRIVTDDLARLRAAASSTSRIVEKLTKDESLLVLGDAAKPQTIDGARGSWIKVRTADGEEGWVFDGYLSPARKLLSRDDFSADGLYEDYLVMASRKGERVRAIEDYEMVKKGDLGSFFSYAEEDLPFMIVWDRDLDATPSDEYLGGEFPRILSDRVYFVDAPVIAIAGEAAVADFNLLALEWARKRSDEFGVGAVVMLGKHLSVSASEGSEDWSPEMDQYVGNEATIVSIEGDDTQGRPIVCVDIDGGDWFWRIENMTLVSSLQEGESAYSDAYDDEYQDASDEPSAATAECYGKIAVGINVVLGKHDEPNGDANWNDDMDEYVGTTATVTELAGTDQAGFLGVRVEGNDWFWRARNLSVASVGESGSYGFSVGDEVILGRHREIGGESNWAGEMDEFVGMRAKITELVGKGGDGADCFTVRVDVDGGEWCWRAENLIPAR